MIVDNRGAGAGGVVGTEVAPNAPPDGYTLLIISIAHAVNPWLYKLPYDPIKAFTPIAILGTGPNVLVVNPELPVKSVKELVDLAKQKPGQLQYASAGVGSFQHLGGELFKLMSGVNILHVPFKGGGPAMIDVIGGHTKVMFSSLVQTTPHIKSGKLRALGVGGLTRNPVLPDVPTDRGEPACRTTRRSTGGASSRPPARRPPIVEQAAQGRHRGAGLARGAEAVRQRGRLGREDEVGASSPSSWSRK